MTATYNREEGRLICSPEALEQIVGTMRGGPFPTDPELSRCGAIHDGEFDTGLGVPLAGIVTAEHEGTIRVIGPEADLHHRFWAASGVGTWWVDGGAGLGQLAALPVELWAHTVVDLTGFGARRVPGEREPELPVEFTWAAPDPDADPSQARDAVARLLAERHEQQFVDSLTQGIWLLWYLRGPEGVDLTVLNTAFGSYGGDGTSWRLLPGRALWLRLAGWEPWNRRTRSAQPFGARPGQE